MIDKSVKLGKGVKIYHPELVNLYGCEIGDNTKIAAFVEIQRGVKVGKNCKIEAFAFICQGITIENEVFIGPHVCFINDKKPKATTREGKLKKSGDWQMVPTLVKSGASIGANATILCGITIGEKSLVGAGSVVTKNVPKEATVVGNPAKILTRT